MRSPRLCLNCTSQIKNNIIVLGVVVIAVVIAVGIVVAVVDVIVVVDEDGGGFIDPDKVAQIVLGLFRSDKQQNDCPYLYI